MAGKRESRPDSRCMGGEGEVGGGGGGRGDDVGGGRVEGGHALTVIDRGKTIAFL